MYNNNNEKNDKNVWVEKWIQNWTVDWMVLMIEYMNLINIQWERSMKMTGERTNERMV